MNPLAPLQTMGMAAPLHTPLVAQIPVGGVSPLSTAPSQLSSLPSQVSASGPSNTPPPSGMPELGQTTTPSRQTVMPGWHSPTQFDTRPPGQLSPQAPPTSVGLSSATKLQSSSMPL